jgi:hypothetical protein
MGRLRDALAKLGSAQMRSKSQTAWETAARCATLAQEADDQEEREYITSDSVMRGPRLRLRDAWTTLAKRCEDFNIPDVAEK